MNNFTCAIVYYFSGTGNSRNVAEWFLQVAAENNLSASMHLITEFDHEQIPQPPDGALLIFISPVHGFNYPPIMLNFLFRFPRGKNKVALMNTRAGMLIGRWITPGLSGIAFYLSAVILLLKGYAIRAMYPVNLPSNWISVHPGLNKPTIVFMHEKCKEQVRKVSAKLLSGGRKFTSLFEIVQDVLIAPVSLGYYFFGRYMIAKTYYASRDCNDCGACIKGCPVHAIIKVDNRPFWTYNCESCMKCMSNCPKKSIETAHGFIILFSWVTFGAVLGFTTALLHGYHIPIDNWFIGTVIECGISLVLLALAYRGFHLILRSKVMERIAVYTSLTKYKFWGRRYKAIRNFQKEKYDR